MPSTPPLTAAGPRDARKKERARAAARAPVDPAYGVWQAVRSGQHAARFYRGCVHVGMKPDVARRWLDRPQVPLVAVLGKASEGQCVPATQGALKRVRDTSENGMTVCAAVRSLEQLNEAEDVRSSGRQQLPGLTIIIQNTPLRAEPLDVTPLPVPIETPKPLPEGVFRPPRRR